MSEPRIQRTESARAIRARLWIVHLASLGIFFVPFTPQLLGWTVAGFFLRVFAWEAGSHRYFSHRSFKTSRAFQFILGALSAAGGQRGPLWWAATHRRHHKVSDSEADVHSPVTRSFLHAHMGWLVDPATVDTDLDAVRDLARYPELLWLNRFHWLFALGTLVAVFLLGQYTTLFGRPGLGLAAVVWVFFFATLLSLHASFAVNTLTHGRRVGWLNQRRFDTGDTTTNSLLLALPTMGASWHNNHHRHMNAARAGFYWWELDLSYLVLRGLEKLHIVWDLQPVPASVLAEGRAERSPA
jgi:stearoyl-CoA desaturase (delta-9 desaturase)